jgi:hypothetical protein
MDKESYSKIALHLYDEEEGRSNEPAGEPTPEFRKECERILAAHEDLLRLFSGDGRLRYVCDGKAKTFELHPRALTVTVPIAFFMEFPFSEDRFLFHVYETLALYPDWRANPDAYLGRYDECLPEAQELTQALLRRVRELGLEGDRAYQPDVVLPNMQAAVADFMDGCDRWAAMLAVRMRSPRYQDASVAASIGEMLLWEDSFPRELHPAEAHQDLVPSLLQAEWYGLESLEEPRIVSVLRGPALGEERYAFVRERLCRQIEDRQEIKERDALIRTFLLPAWLELFEDDLARREFSATVEEEGAGKPGSSRPRRRHHGPQMTEAQKEAMLKDLKAERQERRQAAQELVDGMPRLEKFGVTADDQALFAHYEAKVWPACQRMRRVWHELVGEAAQEVSVKVEGTLTGKLDTHAVIAAWPALVEAERSQNYRNLALFDSYELQRRYSELPRRLRVSFVVDNSGSMRSGKLEPAREALAVVLLSLEDFAQYLSACAALAHERIEVESEVWLFGTHHVRVLSFGDTGTRRRANTVLSVARVAGTDGSTNDGACLAQISEDISVAEKRELESGREIRLVFEVTDGASSFPGAAKKAVEELEKKGAEVHAIEIGIAADEEARSVFDYVFGRRGVFLGEHTDRLPEELLAQLRQGVTRAFLRSRGATRSRSR